MDEIQKGMSMKDKDSDEIIKLDESPAPGEKEKLEKKIILERKFNDGIGWFYWIAGLSIINSIASFMGSSWNFVIGLEVAKVMDVMTQGIDSSFKIIFVILNLCIVGVIIFFGIMAKKGFDWAFIAGLVIYGADTLLCLVFQDYFSLFFHIFAIFAIYSGYNAHKELKSLVDSPY